MRRNLNRRGRRLLTRHTIMLAIFLSLLGNVIGTLITYSILQTLPPTFLRIVGPNHLLLSFLVSLFVYLPLLAICGLLLCVSTAYRRYGSGQSTPERPSSAEPPESVAERGHIQHGSSATAPSERSLATESLRLVTSTSPAARPGSTEESASSSSGILIRPGSRYSSEPESDQSTSRLITPTVYVTPPTAGGEPQRSIRLEELDMDTSEPGPSSRRSSRGRRVVIYEPAETATSRALRAQRRSRAKMMNNGSSTRSRSLKKTRAEDASQEGTPSFKVLLHKYAMAAAAAAAAAAAGAGTGTGTDGAGSSKMNGDGAGSSGVSGHAAKFPSWHDFEQKGVPLGSNPPRAYTTQKKQPPLTAEEFDRSRERFRCGLQQHGSELLQGPKFDDEESDDDDDESDHENPRGQ